MTSLAVLAEVPYKLLLVLYFSLWGYHISVKKVVVDPGGFGIDESPTISLLTTDSSTIPAVPEVTHA
jgi:hypothetical protein